MNFPQSVYERILYYGRESVTGRFFGRCGRGFDRMVANSAIFSALGREGNYDHWEFSRFGALLRKLWGIFPALGKRGVSLKENSAIASYVIATIGNWEQLPLAWIGSLVTALSIMAYGVLGILGLAAFLIPGLLLMAAPATLGGLLANSRLIALFCDAEFEAVPARRGLYYVPFLFGMAVSVLSLFGGTLVGVLCFGAVIGGAVLLCYPQVGLWLLILGAPFLPTMVLAAVAVATVFCYFIAQIGGAERPYRMDNTGLFLAGFCLLLLFFGLTSYTPLKSTEIAVLECAFLFSYYLVLWLLDGEKHLSFAVFLFLLGAFGAGLIGLYQYLSGDVNTTWTDTSLFEELQLRVYSTFENPNVYGEYLLLTLPCAAVMCYVAKKPLLKLFYGGTALLLLINLALTYSRGCYLALIFICFLVVCWGMRQLLIFVPFALAAMPFVMPDSIIARFSSITNFSDTSTSYRLNIWFGTMNMLENFIFLGIGLGQEAFTTLYPRYQLNQIFAPHAHNLFLQVTTEMGLGGLILLLAVLLSFFVVGYTAHRKVKGSAASWFILVMMAAVGGYLFEGLFDNVWYNYRVFLIFFLVLGIVTAVCRLVHKEGMSPWQKQKQKQAGEENG